MKYTAPISVVGLAAMTPLALAVADAPPVVEVTKVSTTLLVLGSLFTGSWSGAQKAVVSISFEKLRTGIADLSINWRRTRLQLHSSLLALIPLLVLGPML